MRPAQHDPCPPPFREQARFFRSPALPEAELLTARYYSHTFAPHWHEGYVVGVITAGAEGYRYRGAQHVAGAGALACINPDEIHTGQRADDSGWAYRVFYPSAGTMQGLARCLRGRPCAGLPRLPHAVIHDRLLATTLARAHQLLEAGLDVLEAQTAALAALTALLTRHAQEPEAAPPPRGESARAEAMRQRLAADLAEPLTLDELAASVGLSAFHAARLFARETGLPPHAWRNQLRLNRSLPLLRAGASAGEAAAACGFADQSHFTRHFRRTFGVTPGRWRAA
ncbi:MAG: AraC family transcriptional regulator [Proteobacteria bacterium]|nr:AraC family transcriptional regulator [Pseudomonadota bacterium]MBU1594993.1 AraC family transcriptional regulator [Pseudomonadota bacterium]